MLSTDEPRPGALPPVSEQRLLREIRTVVAEEVGLPRPADVDAESVFSDVGLDSAGVVVLAGRLEDLTGLEIPAETVLDHPTARRLASWLAARSEGSGRCPGPDQ